MAVALLYTALVTPAEVAFLSMNEDSKAWPFPIFFSVNRVLDALFLTDLFLQARGPTPRFLLAIAC